MIQTIASKDRHLGDFGWLKTRWHFSFGDYYDPANENHGALRVFNDDIVEGGGGFGAHPHRDMEIISVVLDGALEHSDSLGHKTPLKTGEVQVMSAGSGIRHAEYNHSQTQPVHFLQIWIFPRNRGTKPRWEQKSFDPAGRQGKLQTIVSDGSVPGSLAIDQDAKIYLSDLSAGQSVSLDTSPARKPYLFVIEGTVKLNGVELAQGDQGRVSDENSLIIEATSNARIILIDVPDLKD